VLVECVLAPSQEPVTDTVELLNGDSAPVAFGGFGHRFADDVI